MTIVIAVSLLTFVLEAGVPMNETNAAGDYDVGYEESMPQGKETGSVDFHALARDLKSLEWERRLAAVSKLSKIRDEYAIKLLVGALVDINLNVTVSAVRGLAELGGEEVVAALRSALKKRDRVLRVNALAVLRLMKSEEAMPLIIEMLNDKNAAVRENAANALSLIKDPRSVSYLKTMRRKVREKYEKNDAKGISRINIVSPKKILSMMM